ncbi:hypothetical protein T439DRAFT_379064 [Meredithblackwellia eburnea MCA 4105]
MEQQHDHQLPPLKQSLVLVSQTHPLPSHQTSFSDQDQDTPRPRTTPSFSSQPMSAHSHPEQPTQSTQPTQPPLSSSESQHQQQWEAWVRSYSAGEWKPDVQPPIPPAIAQVLDQRKNEQTERTDLHLYPSSNGMSDQRANTSPAGLLSFFKKHGYFPGPPSEHEDERLAMMARYGLDDPVRRKAIDRICRVAKTYFKTSTVLITLVFENHQVVAAERGWASVDPGMDEPVRKITYNPSLCVHHLTRSDPNSVFIVPDASADWRFRENPYTPKHGGILSFYAGAQVHLPTVTKRKNVPETLPVGSLCVIDSVPRAREAFTEEDETMLRDLADCVAREFQLGIEQTRRHVEIQQAEFLGSFLNSTLVHTPSTATQMVPPAPLSPTSQTGSFAPSASPEPSFQPPPPPSFPPPPPSIQQDATPPRRPSLSTKSFTSSFSSTAVFLNATEQLRTLTGGSSAAVLDIRSLRAPKPASRYLPRERPKTPTSSSTGDKFRTGSGTVTLIGSAGNVDWDKVVAREEISDIVCSYVEEYYQRGVTLFDGVSQHNPFASLIPQTTTGSIVAPVFDVDGNPALILVITSSLHGFVFDKSDKTFVLNCGAVVMGTLLRKRAIEADRAKLAFVSQVSHELRTPLHGISSQVELIREFSTPAQLIKLAPALDVADVCLEALRDVLDDTLDFAKLSNSAADAEAAYQRSLTPADLDRIAEDVAKSVWIRKRRVDLASVDTQGGKPLPSPRGTAPGVDVILEVEERAEGWCTMVDVGGMKRVLLNLCGNALKFTNQGHVKITLRYEPESISEEDPRRFVYITIEDTGCGMAADFIASGMLFTPFVQENPFANGAGLGMSICDTIVKRMSGKIDVVSTLGKGTTIRVAVPLNFLPPQVDTDSPDRSPSFTRTKPSLSPGGTSLFQCRIISDELGNLFNPAGSSHVLSTPQFEREGFDFSQAVEAVQASIGSTRKLGRVPSKRVKRSIMLGGKLEDADLASEAAKLTISETLATSPPKPPSFFDIVPAPSTAVNISNISRDPAAIAPAPPNGGLAPDVRVLIADDNPIARNILAKLFSGKGVAFDQAEDGQVAINLYKSSFFNLLLLDVQMPNKDGIQAAYEIREYEKKKNLPRARIVALTGLSSEQEMERGVGVDGPVDHWLVKGGRSMRIVLEEVTSLQKDISAARVEKAH